MIDKEDASLAKFGKPFQEKLAQLILDDTVFADQVGEVLKTNFLELKYLQEFTKIIYDYRDQYGKYPSRTTVESILRSEIDNLNATVQKQVRDFYAKIAANSLKEVNEEYVKEKSIDFCRKQTLKEAMLKSVQLMEKSSFDEVQKVINQALKLGSDNEQGYEYMKHFEARYLMKARNPVSTGWDVIDGFTQGGLGKGELGVVIAPTGAGKTMKLVHIGAAAVQAGKNVVHYTLELADTVVGVRYDACITGFPLNSLHGLKDEVFEQIKDVKGKLIIKEYPTKSASTATIRSHLTRVIQRGFEVDLIIVDYGDLLKPCRYEKEKRNELEGIYEELRGLAGEFECPLWTASQTNRCFSTNTKLLISRGGKLQSMRIGDVIEGDLVETHKGYKKITKVFPKETQKTYKITLKSGKIMICSVKHQFPMADGTLRSISEGMKPSEGMLVKK